MNNELSKINLTGWVIGVSAFIVNVIIIFIIISSASDMSGEVSNPTSDSEGFLMSTYTYDLPNGEKITSSSAKVYNQTWLNFDGVNDNVIIYPTRLMSNYSVTYFAYININSSLIGNRDFLSWQNTIFRRTNTGLSWFPDIDGSSSNFVYNLNNSDLFVAITQQGTTCRFNINNLYNSTISCSSLVFINDSFKTRIGSYSNLNYFGGKIYFVGVLNNSLGVEGLHDIYYNRDNFSGLNQGIPILGMHYVDNINTTYYTNISEFTKYMDYLYNNNFHTITFSQFANYTKGLYTLPINPVILSFDDGDASIYNNAKPIMDLYGFVGCANVISSSVNTSGKMNWTMLQEMVNDGWEVASHSHNHSNVTSLLNYNDRIQQYNLSKFIIDNNLTDINGNKYNTTSFIYPYTTFNLTDLTEVDDYYSFSGGQDNYIHSFSLGYNYGYKNTPLYGRFERLAISNTTSYKNFTDSLYYVLHPNINNIAIFKFNENSGTTAYDSSGNGNNGTISGATWQNDGVLVSLTEDTDFSINKVSGLLTLLNPTYLFSYITASWTESNIDDSVSVLRGNVSAGVDVISGKIPLLFLVLIVGVILIVLGGLSALFYLLMKKVPSRFSGGV